MKIAYKYNDEQPMTRMTCRDEYGNADIIGLEDVMHEFMLSLDYPDMVHLTEALNRFADLEESKIEALQEQKTGQWITKSDTNPYYTTWWYECSECGQYPPRDGYGQEVLSDYCPHCGCRMECEENAIH